MSKPTPKNTVATISPFASGNSSANLPPPPPELTEEEAGVWQSVVTTEHEAHFTPAAQPILAAYCRSVARVRALNRQVEATLQDPDVKPSRLNVLTLTEGQAINLMANLATALRLTPKSRQTGAGGRPPNSARRPV